MDEPPIRKIFQDRDSVHWKIWLVVKWSVFAVTTVFMVQRGWAIWQRTPPGALQINGWWLIPAVAFYGLGWIPSVMFWRMMMAGCGQKPPWYAAMRAYYIGALGKYTPGKAMVLVLRSSLVKDHGVRPTIAVVTVAYETLANMGSGMGIATALAPLATSPSVWQQFPDWVQPLRKEALLLPLIVVAATLILLPLISRVFTAVAAKMAPKVEDQPPASVSISTRMLLEGLGLLTCGWVLFGFSLGCVVTSLHAGSFELLSLPMWMASVSLAVVGGFLFPLVPGGFGVREMLFTEVLQSQPGVTEAQAFVAAWLVRVVWMTSDVLFALTFLRPMKATQSLAPSLTPNEPANETVTAA